MCDAASTELMNHPVRRLPLIARPKVLKRMRISARRIILVTRLKVPELMKNSEAKQRRILMAQAQVLKPAIVNQRLTAGRTLEPQLHRSRKRVTNRWMRRQMLKRIR